MVHYRIFVWGGTITGFLCVESLVHRFTFSVIRLHGYIGNSADLYVFIYIYFNFMVPYMLHIE